jgi:DNA-directed RNA polymerase subunit RPC12/RpoP
MRLRDFYCDSCDFRMPSGFGEYRYVVTDDGERQRLHHPAEILQILDVLGEDASDELIEERTGYRAYYVCRRCGAAFEAERGEADDCPECGHGDVVTQNELVGKPCPRCEEGTFVDETTGIT